MISGRNHHACTRGSGTTSKAAAPVIPPNMGDMDECLWYRYPTQTQAKFMLVIKTDSKASATAIIQCS